MTGPDDPARQHPAMSPHSRILDAAREVAARTPLQPDPSVDVPLIWPARTGPNGGMRWIVATIPEMGALFESMRNSEL